MNYNEKLNQEDIKNFKDTLEMDPTKQDLKGDPLEDFRGQEVRPSGASVEGEYAEEDNAAHDRVVERLSLRDKFIPIEELPDGEYFEMLATELEMPTEEQQELDEVLSADDSHWVQRYGLEESKGANKNESQEVLTYNLEEFKLLEKCSIFMARHHLPEAVRKQRPMFLKRKDGSGIEMNDEQIAQQVEAYEHYKEGKNDFSYRPDELEFMRRCAAWNYYDKKISHIPENAPKMTDGRPISSDEIEKLAREYADFRRNKPEEFAKLKVEKGEWSVGDFEWSKEYYNKKGNSTAQWVAYKLQEGEGGKRGAETKYISEYFPVESSGKFYYKVMGEFKDTKHNFNIKFVSLKHPTDSSLRMAEKIDAEKQEEVEV